MKNKVSLMLMEQLVMVLAFALGAALCLSVFLRADSISKETARREEAAILAQSAVEILKSGGDISILDAGEYTIVTEPRFSDVPGYLNRAAVVVQYEGEALLSLEAAWQEVRP